MITNQLAALIERLTDTAVTELRLERELRVHLLAADQALRSEIAYAMHDALLMHGDLQTPSFARIEQYIAFSCKLAKWHADRDLAQDDLDAILASLEESHFLGDMDDDDGV